MSGTDSIGLAELLAVASGFTFAVSQVALRHSLREGTPLAAALLINAIVCLGGLGTALVKGTLLTSTRTPLLWYAGVGIFGPGIARIAGIIGIERMGVSRSLAIASSTPIWGTLAAVAVLGERPTAAVLVGTLSIVGGVTILSLREDEKLSYASWFRGALVFPLVASLAYSIPPIFAKLAFAHQKTPMVGIAVAFAVGNIVLLAGKPLLPGGGKIHASRSSWLWFFFAGVFNLFSSILLWQAFSLGDVSTTLPLSRVAPFWTLLLGYLFLRKVERITPRVVLATFLVVAGAVFITANRS